MKRETEHYFQGRNTVYTALHDFRLAFIDNRWTFFIEFSSNFVISILTRLLESMINWKFMTSGISFKSCKAHLIISWKIAQYTYIF